MHIKMPYSIIPACDVSANDFDVLIANTHMFPEVSAYKLGFVLGLSIGLPQAVAMIRKYTDKPIIYDHQKAGTDIPETGHAFCRTCKDAGIDSVIFFPQAGPRTQESWIQAARDCDLHVIVGGRMTHAAYIRSQGGYLADDAIAEMYTNAAKMGVTDYVVPGNNPEAVASIFELIAPYVERPRFFSPGFLAQGGSIATTATASNADFHAIVGRGIYAADDQKHAMHELCKQIQQLQS